MIMSATDLSHADHPAGALSARQPDRSATGRLVSIDALRGFDMFWIIGGDAFVRALSHYAWAHWRWTHSVTWLSPQVVDEQLEHVPWQGFHFYDLIFPLFLFVVGAVLPFSVARRRERGDSRADIWRHILVRTVVLFLLGVIYNGLFRLDFGTLRIAGVLQRIAICYGIAAAIVLVVGVRVQALIMAALLLGYWALLAFVAPPGGTAGDYSIQGNLDGWVDRHYLPGKIYQAYYGYGDNEGILSTIPAVATALLGALAGQLLRTPMAAGFKIIVLAIAGGACLAGGHYWDPVFPVIKNLWTSSYVLVAGGWSLLLLALFYTVIDVLRLRRWAFPFVVIGANAITIYVGRQIIDFHHIADFFVGGAVRASGDLGPVLTTGSVLVVEWLFLWFLYRQRLFLRV